jgi:hypothetical protein
MDPPPTSLPATDRPPPELSSDGSASHELASDRSISPELFGHGSPELAKVSRRRRRGSDEGEWRRGARPLLPSLQPADTFIEPLLLHVEREKENRRRRGKEEIE